jgi:hypothetical protein
MSAALAMLILAANVTTPPVLPRWNPKAPENTETLPAFSYASVEPVLTAVGARFRRTGNAPSRPQLAVTFPNNRTALITLGNCDAEGAACKALSMQSYWTRIANASPERTADAIAAFNQRYSFAKAFVGTDGRPALQRYLTADYGFIRGNLAVNFLVFASQADQFARRF